MAQIDKLDDLGNFTCLTVGILDEYIGRTRKNDKTVYEYCLKNSNKKHVNAILGYIWQYGICGVAKDLKKAFQYYEIATNYGIMQGRSKYNYHPCMFDDTSLFIQTHAEEWWKVGASCDNADSHYNLGELYFAQWKYIAALEHFIEAYRLYDCQRRQNMIKDKQDCVNRIREMIDNVYNTLVRQQYSNKNLPSISEVVQVVMSKLEPNSSLKNYVMECIKTKEVSGSDNVTDKQKEVSGSDNVTDKQKEELKKANDTINEQKEELRKANEESRKLKEEAQKSKDESQKLKDESQKLKDELTKFSNASQTIKIMGNNAVYFALRQLIIAQSKFIDLKQFDKLTKTELNDIKTLCLSQENNGTAFAALGYIAKLEKQMTQASEYWTKGANLNNIVCIKSLASENTKERIEMLVKGFFLGDIQCKKELAAVYYNEKPEIVTYIYVDMLYDEKDMSMKQKICIDLMNLVKFKQADLSYLFTHPKYNAEILLAIPDMKAIIAKYIFNMAEEIDKDPESGKSLFQRAIIAQFKQNKSFDDVRKLYERSAEKIYFNADYYLGNMCNSQSNHIDAVFHYMRAMQHTGEPFMQKVCLAKINAICMDQETHMRLINRIMCVEHKTVTQGIEIDRLTNEQVKLTIERNTAQQDNVVLGDMNRRLEKGLKDHEANINDMKTHIQDLEYDGDVLRKKNVAFREENETLKKEIVKLQEKLTEDIVRINPDDDIELVD